MNALEGRPFAQHMNVKFPIFGFCHGAKVVAALARVGGFGVLGATRHTPQEIRADLNWIRSQVGDRPFGVNLVLPDGMPDADDRAAIEAQIPDEHRQFVDSLYTKYGIPSSTKPGMRSRFVRSNDMAELQLEAVLASDVNLVACGIGAPPAIVKRLQARGKRVVALVGSTTHAVRALESGVDMLVAQGYDAGAHTGVIGTFSLVPQIVDVAGDVPVLAAGGVATGRHIAAALALGASGVWMGTRWLTTTEYAGEIPRIVQQKLLDAGSEDTVISRADSGKTLRQIRSAWSDEWAAPGAPKPLRMPLQDILVGDLLGAIDEYEIKALMHYPAGQSVAYCKTVQTVAETMTELVNEADLCMRSVFGERRSAVSVPSVE